MKKKITTLLSIMLLLSTFLIGNLSQTAAEGENDLANATVLLEGEQYRVYTGSAIVPKLVVKSAYGTLNENEHYTVEVLTEKPYDNTNVSVESSDINFKKIGGLKIKGISPYTGSKIVTFSIIPILPVLEDGELNTLTYNGQDQSLIKTAMGIPEELNGKVSISYVQSTTSTAPTGSYTTQSDSSKITGKAAGTYYVWYNTLTSPGYTSVTLASFQTSSNSNAVTISKADSVFATSPSAKDNLSYTGSEQELINAGVAGTDESGSGVCGTIYYSLTKTTFSSSDKTGWSTSVPKGKDAGDYTVYYVIEGDSNHNDTSVSNVSVNIAKTDATFADNGTPSAASNLTYSGSAQNLTTGGTVATDESGTGTKGTIYYSLIDSTFDSNNKTNWSTTIPSKTDAGTYTVYYVIEGDKNHNNSTVGSFDTIISKASSTYATEPSKKTLTYNTQNQDLVNAGTAKTDESGSGVCGTIYYSLTDSTFDSNNKTNWSTTVPQKKDAGDYTVYYVIEGDKNHSDSSVGNTTVTIDKATENVPTLDSATYNGSSQMPKISSSDLAETSIYKINTSPIAQTNAGDYNIVLELKDADNYKWSSPDSGNAAQATIKYTIDQYDVSSDSIASLSTTDYTFISKDAATGTINPVVTVKSPFDSSVELTKDTDYTITYPNDCINVGNNKTITLSFEGNYKGSLTVDFNILAKTIESSHITFTKSSYTYTGSDIDVSSDLSVKVTDDLVKDTDYELEYTNHKNVSDSTVTVTVKGKGNYDGTPTKTFTITPKAIDDSNVSLSPDNKDYTGEELTTDVVITDSTSSSNLVKDTDFEVTYPTNHTDAGDYNITITGKGNYSGTFNRTFSINKLTLLDSDISGVETSYEYTGSDITPTVTITHNSKTLVKDTDYEVSYSSNKNVGTATITVTGKGNYKGTATKTFSITKPTITSDDITIDDGSTFTYTGSALTPSISVSHTVGTVENDLVKDTDYTVTYTSNTDAGTATITVTGINNYQGTPTKTFTINPKAIVESNIGNPESKEYTGSALTTTVSITDSDLSYTLIENTDYEITYPTNHTDAGDYTITITGKGNYSGTFTKTFTITPKALVNTNVGDPESKDYTGNALTTTVAVSDSVNGTLTENTDYEITYPTNHTDAGDYNITITGKGNYSGTFNRTFSINKLTLVNDDISGVESSYVYTGSDITPTVTITHNSKTLVKDTDYEVSYSSNKNVGTATITVTGKGNYKGTPTATFTITSDAILESDITLTKTSYTYTSKEIKDVPTVVHNQTTLIEDTDYTLSYANNTAVGTATVTVTGKGNYSGTPSKTYTIEKADIDDLTITWDEDDKEYVYTSEAIIPTLTVKLGDVTLTKDTHYSVTASNNIDVTTSATCTLTMIDTTSFEGTEDYTFTIVKAEASKWSASLTSGQTLVYSGSEIKPTLDVKGIGGTALETGKYTIDYSNNINAGTDTGKATVTASNYKGEKEVTFTIDQKDISSDVTLTLDKEQYLLGVGAVQPSETVKFGLTELTSGSDYTVSYGDNNTVGDEAGLVTITGTGNYKGTLSKKFKIVDIDVLVQQLSNGDLVIQADEEYLTQLGKLSEQTDGSSIEIDFGGTNKITLDKSNVTSNLTPVEDQGTYTLTIPYSLFKSINEQVDREVNPTTDIDPSIDRTQTNSDVLTSITFKVTLTPGKNLANKTSTDIKTTRGKETINVASYISDYDATTNPIYLNGNKLDDTTIVVNDYEDVIIQTFTYNTTSPTDIHTQYPTGFKVYLVTRNANDTWLEVKHLEGLDSIMSYQGTQIRTYGYNGIRILTSIPKASRNNLLSTTTGVEGYYVMEYGTVLGWSEELSTNDPSLNRGDSSTSYKFANASNCSHGNAYERGVRNVVFKQNSDKIFYTNVITDKNGNWNSKLDKDFKLRSYMILRPIGATDGSKDVIIYGGTLNRSIEYVANQILNSNYYKAGSAEYNYLKTLVPDEQ